MNIVIEEPSFPNITSKNLFKNIAVWDNRLQDSFTQQGLVQCVSLLFFVVDKVGFYQQGSLEML